MNEFEEPNSFFIRDYTINVTEKLLKAATNDQILLHEQDNRLLKIQYPEIEIIPHYLGMFATDGIDGWVKF
jgi:hypothetical protein